MLIALPSLFLFSLSLSTLSLSLPLPIRPIVNPTGLRLRARSRTATRVPGAARSIASAAARPAGPPPTMQTSTSVTAAAATMTPALRPFLRSAGNERIVLLCTPRRRVLEGGTRGSALLCIAFLSSKSWLSFKIEKARCVRPCRKRKNPILFKCFFFVHRSFQFYNARFV